jgi:hypothetical protein
MMKRPGHLAVAWREFVPAGNTHVDDFRGGVLNENGQLCPGACLACGTLLEKQQRFT